MPATSYTRSHIDQPNMTNTEWLLTNGLGGFAMGTVSTIPTRRYHGLLVASQRPPVNRIMALSALAESIIEHQGTALETRHDLSCFCFSPGVIHPRGDQLIKSFTKNVSVRWVYDLSRITVEKAVHVVQNQPAVIIRYTIDNQSSPNALLSLRPLVALRDFHALILRDTARELFTIDARNSVVKVAAGSARITLDCAIIESPQQSSQAKPSQPSPTQPSPVWTTDGHWWNNFQLGQEVERGYDYLEDLFNPGAYSISCPRGTTIIEVRCALGDTLPVGTLPEHEAQRKAKMTGLLAAARVSLGPAFEKGGPHEKHPLNTYLPGLVQAADDFVVRRVRPGALAGAPADRVTIIAGYPWFADWGRDSMISLVGLLLTTGRLIEAREVLRTFAAACKDGLIPNLFDDYSGQAHYNTVDASLWFVHAACSYLAVSGDSETFALDLLPACLEVVEKYRTGTHFGIAMDPDDGLLRAGDHTTQLTWMDAKRDGVVFTPRHGKPVEISALWYNALMSLASLAQTHPGLLDPHRAKECADLASKVQRSFSAKFWNAEQGCLFDVLNFHDGHETPDASLRPNQLFAVSLPHSPLSKSQQQAIVEAARTHLLTPMGMRTLQASDWRYKGRFRGRMFDRDAAYHNGTVWPWLIGPFAEALCRAHDFSPAARAQAWSALDSVITSMDQDCLGQIAEVFDGDDSPEDPRRAGGCPAQAWSVAETLRAAVMVARGSD